MKFYKGDIVEIITGRYKSWNEIPAHERAYFENQNQPAPIIGQRFRVDNVYQDSISARIKGVSCLHVSSDSIMLIRRSFKNWLKYYFSGRLSRFICFLFGHIKDIMLTETDSAIYIRGCSRCGTPLGMPHAWKNCPQPPNLTEAELRDWEEYKLKHLAEVRDSVNKQKQ
jgi:hypothetical protein